MQLWPNWIQTATVSSVRQMPHSKPCAYGRISIRTVFPKPMNCVPLKSWVSNLWILPIKTQTKILVTATLWLNKAATPKKTAQPRKQAICCWPPTTCTAVSKIKWNSLPNRHRPPILRASVVCAIYAKLPRCPAIWPMY